MRLMTLGLATALIGAAAIGDELDDIEAIFAGEPDAAEESALLPQRVAGLELPEEPPDFPGGTTRVVDPYRVNAPNPLFLSSLPGKLWWDEQAETRVPVLVTEPVGLPRQNQPVSIIHTFPSGTLPESIRVVTPYGRELASQVRVLDGAVGELEVLLVMDRLSAFAQVPLFVYYGTRPIDRPQPAASDTGLRIEKRERGVALVNNRLQAEFSRKVAQDKYPVWRVLKGHGMAYNMVSEYPTSGYGSSALCDVPAGTPVRVLEDGPVRKTVSYGEWGEAFTVSLYADSPLLYVRSPSKAQSWGFWLPGGDTLNDVLCYESTEGLKRMPIEYTGGWDAEPYTYQHLKEWYKEGWFALLDEASHQGLGWFFDLEPGRVWIQTVAYGYWVSVSSPGQSALYVASDDRTESCRNAYIAWKCPPLVSLGKPQPFVVIEPRVPLFGQDFIRMHIKVGRYHPRTGPDTAIGLVDDAQANGANYLMFSTRRKEGRYEYFEPSAGKDGKPGPAMFDELIAECHRRGMGMCHGLSTDLNVRTIREMVRRGADAIWVCDEWGWGPNGYYPFNEDQRREFLAGTWKWGHTNFSAAERADFRKRYGSDMPDTSKVMVRGGGRDRERDELDDLLADESSEMDGLLEPPRLAPPGPFSGLASTNLNDPSQLAMFRMMIDAHNLLMSDLAKVARENNTNVFVTATTSPNNLVVGRDMGAFNDLETLADSFSSVVVDLYSNDGGWLNSMIKYARGAQGNRRPLLIIGGYAGWDSREAVAKNLSLQLLYGANSLCYFVLDRICTPWPGLGSKDVYDMIDYTGLGDFAAKAWPFEFVGVLRDRDEFFASLKRGETAYPGGAGSRYELSVLAYLRAMGFQLPSNVIAAKRLKAELAYPYKLIMVPSNATLSDENAALLRDYVKGGGHLILEGATLRNAILASLAKVSAVGECRSGKLSIKGVKRPLVDWSANLACSWQSIKVGAGAEVLATRADGEPAVTVAETGRGKVIAIAPSFGSQARMPAVSALMRRLVEYAVGFVPVRIEPADAAAFTTVLTDGSRCLISLFNDPRQKDPSLSLVLTGFPSRFESLVSLITGRRYRVVDNRVDGLSVPIGEADCFMLTDRIAMPRADRQRGTPISQSLQPGMEFLNLPPEE